MSQIKFNWSSELIQVDTDDIVYFEADRNYTFMMLNVDKKILIPMNLKTVKISLKEQLGRRTDEFAYVGRKHIIRKSYVMKMEVLNKTLLLFSKTTNKTFNLKIGSDALRQFKRQQENAPITSTTDYHLKDINSGINYPLLSGSMLVGRQVLNNDCDIAIDNGDKLISRKHFEITVLQDQNNTALSFEIRDTNSSNGTFVNEKRVAADTTIHCVLGDKIQVGNTYFVIEMKDLGQTELLL